MNLSSLSRQPAIISDIRCNTLAFTHTSVILTMGKNNQNFWSYYEVRTEQLVKWKNTANRFESCTVLNVFWLHLWQLRTTIKNCSMRHFGPGHSWTVKTSADPLALNRSNSLQAWCISPSGYFGAALNSLFLSPSPDCNLLLFLVLPILSKEGNYLITATIL